MWIALLAALHSLSVCLCVCISGLGIQSWLSRSLPTFELCLLEGIFSLGLLS